MLQYSQIYFLLDTFSNKFTEISFNKRRQKFSRTWNWDCCPATNTNGIHVHVFIIINIRFAIATCINIFDMIGLAIFQFRFGGKFSTL